MDTALYESREQLTTGRGSITLIFGEFDRGIASLLMDNGTVLHVHDAGLCGQLVRQFRPGSRIGSAIIYKADNLGIVREYRAL
jgi:hypothetical protein